jgi:hypothetical protein
MFFSRKFFTLYPPPFDRDVIASNLKVGYVLERAVRRLHDLWGEVQRQVPPNPIDARPFSASASASALAVDFYLRL